MKFQGVENIYDASKRQFGRTPDLIVSAPGRVNLIGEHTDYNDGFVLPMAIDRKIRVGGSLRDDEIVRLYSLNFQEMSQFSVISLRKTGKWTDYVQGVIDEFLKAGEHVKGFDAVLYGDVPLGSGLSSSAAMEVATAFFLAQLNDTNLSPEEMAKLCQRAENRFVGMNCGIMDQFISRLGQEGHALYLDCRDLHYEQIPFKLDGYTIVICNSHVKRHLVNSAYNERRAQCEEGVRLLQPKLGQITALRDVSSDQLDTYKALLPPIVYRRCKHVITENERVMNAVLVLKRGDIPRFGELLNQSHESLRHDYEVSCPELNYLVEIARQVNGTIGSRMTGAGFGGCTVSIVQESALEEFKMTILEEYAKRTGITAEIYVSKAEDGARVEARKNLEFRI
jgi:galactokinase